MNSRVRSGVLVLAISLCLMGAATSSGGAIGASISDTISSRSLPDNLVNLVDELASPQVPLRSGNLADQPEPESGPSPVAVRIGDIALEAPVIPVGVDSENQFAVPAAEQVGWYRFGPRPGTEGSAVLAAHVDYGGKPGAFFNLAELRVGDPIEVELSDGSVLRYRVTGNTEYDKTDLPFEDVFRKEGSEVLQLITCGGTFDPNARSYEANIVVTALPEALVEF